MRVDQKTYSLSIVVPVYRSAEILPLLVRTVGEEMHSAGLDGRFELVLVNDSSPDNSWEVIRTLAREFPFVKGISLRRNFGQHNATMAGLNHATGEFVVIMDDDLQHPPSAIGTMVATLLEGYDVCYTNYLNRQHAAWKKFGSKFNDWVATRLLDKPKGLYLSSFKALRKEVVDEVIKYDGPYAYLDGLILDVTRSIKTVDIHHQARQDGKGNYNLSRSLSLWLKMATSFSVLPLRIASIAGFSLASLSMVFIAIVIIEKLRHPEIQAGWSSLIATILFIGGIQTLCIGMVGEYLGRTYLKLNRKPQYVVAHRTWEG
ncbi:glycosyltransferase family 2 protein [Paraburkholderia sabiae]|uniref:Glycosyltransferase family 2 protein n=1 Tax=Paraburkholderia sabiae TaxID=273251 RepID=A0ABU9QJY4_9BURK|nr:glycosyltransferase family 2 protein [Paraburkholderia sabiae]WJZ73488.1 glycosyltransferase family 2 protein [Paraburkholderia sabiae]CAD6542169.1 Undecaprenyl-phosphate 4-deoxy-4-formamido-L-arabinose transferase [Paraburkholderia sabiae]